MRSLYLRIWLTVLAALALFAGASGWLVQRHLDQERERLETAAQGRLEAWADLLQRSLPAADAPTAEQAEALREWGTRLRLPMALDDARGQRIAATELWQRRETEGRLPMRRSVSVRLDDGRTLWTVRAALWRPAGFDGGAVGPGPGPVGRPGSGLMGPPHGHQDRGAVWPLVGWIQAPGGLSVLALVVLMFIAVAAGAWPVVRRLTRRLEALQRGVETFGAGALHHRVAEDGRDEVAALAASFNRAAQRIESLVQSHQRLLAHASHELRSPLARLKMAVEMFDETAPEGRASLRAEIHANIAELDALVEEVLLASRLDAAPHPEPESRAPLDWAVLVVDEATRAGAQVRGLPDGAQAWVLGEEKLLRRALRNLLENAHRYGGTPVQVALTISPQGTVACRVCDRGPGVPEDWRDRIFEPFVRLPGHAEREGGVGLGLSLVRQIAQRHGGQVRCDAGPTEGSCFTLTLPLAVRN